MSDEEIKKSTYLISYKSNESDSIAVVCHTIKNSTESNAREIFKNYVIKHLLEQYKCVIAMTTLQIPTVIRELTHVADISKNPIPINVLTPHIYYGWTGQSSYHTNEKIGEYQLILLQQNNDPIKQVVQTKPENVHLLEIKNFDKSKLLTREQRDYKMSLYKKYH